MDLMFIDGRAILHIVDTATKFSAATYLEKYGQSTIGIWNAFVDCWCTIYTGYPYRIKCDSGSVFTSEKWKALNCMAGTNISISRVEAHNSLGMGKRLHSPVRRIFYKVRTDHPTVRKELLLRIAIKAMNDTIGEDGLVPSLLVLGIVPIFPILNTNLPQQQERMKALITARQEMNSIIAERRVTTALQKSFPSSIDRVYKKGDEILVFREKTKRWTGPGRSKLYQ